MCTNINRWRDINMGKGHKHVYPTLFDSTMHGSTMQDRLASFRAAVLDGKTVRWKHKIPTMISMARSFYIFDPEHGLADQVSCSECGLKLAKWQKFSSSPLERHAKINLSCFVSRLGELSLNINANTAVLTMNDIVTTCQKSYKNSPLEHLSLKLGSQGFIYMKSNSINVEAVGCISCLCFPQNGSENPEHKGKCKLARILSDLEEAQYDENYEDATTSASECELPQQPHSELLQILKPTPVPTALELLQGLKLSRSEDDVENSHEILKILAEKVKMYYDDMLMYYAQDPVTFQTNMKVLQAQTLQYLTANCINLVRYETEKVVGNMIAGGLSE